MQPVARACAEAGVDFVPTLIVGPAPDAVRPALGRGGAGARGAARRGLDLRLGWRGPPVAGAPGEPGRAASARPPACRSRCRCRPRAACRRCRRPPPSAPAPRRCRRRPGPSRWCRRAPRPRRCGPRSSGGGRTFDCQPSALDRAARVVGPMLPADRLRQAAAAVFGPAVAVPPALESGLISRLGRLGLSRSLVAGRDRGRPPSRATSGAATLRLPARRRDPGPGRPPRHRGPPLGRDRARAGPGGPRARRAGCAAPVLPEALEAAAAADPGPPPLRDLAAVDEEAPPGLSEEDLVLWAMFAETTEQVVARRRSLGAEAANRPGQPAIDRDLLETLVDVVEASDEAEVSVEISGARVTVRRAAASVAEARRRRPRAAATVSPSPRPTTGSSASRARWSGPSTAARRPTSRPSWRRASTSSPATPSA